MQMVIDFLANHYIAFVIITVLLIFSLIGYLVDTNKDKVKVDKKNNNEINNKENISVENKKEKKEKVKKPKKKKEKKEDIIDENIPSIEEVLAQSEEAKPIITNEPSSNLTNDQIVVSQPQTIAEDPVSNTNNK